VGLEIIATSYRSMIFKPYVFSLYSHPCIYIATHLHRVYLDWLQEVLPSNSRCTWRWWSSELTYTLRGLDRASLEMQLEAVIEWTQRCIWRPWSSTFGDGLGDQDGVNSEIHSEALTERVSKYTWRPGSSELRDALRGCERASLEMHLQAIIERGWRSTCRWLSGRR